MGVMAAHIGLRADMAGAALLSIPARHRMRRWRRPAHGTPAAKEVPARSRSPMLSLHLASSPGAL
jgi:hypothetical protein